MKLIGDSMDPSKFRAIVIVAVTIGLGLCSTFIWAAVQGGLGLIVIAIIWAFGMGMFQLLPYLAGRLENKILELRKEEARAHKVEQVQNHYKRRLQFVENLKTALSQFKGQIDTSRADVEANLKECKTYDPTDRNKKIAMMESKYIFLKDMLRVEEEKNVALKYKVKDTESDVKSEKAIEAALKTMGLVTGTSSESFIDNVLANEAFTSANQDFNTIFAQLELEAEKAYVNNPALNFEVTDADGNALKRVQMEA